MSQHVVSINKSKCNKAVDCKCLLYQSPKDKFNYQIIEEYSVQLRNRNVQILLRFSTNNNNINFVDLFKILVKAVDRNYLRVLLVHKIKDQFCTFLSEFYDKRNFISFWNLLATQFSKKNVMKILLKKNGYGDVFLENASLHNNKISCSQVLTIILESFGIEFFKEALRAKDLNGNNLLQSICHHDDQKELEDCLELLMSFDKEFLRNLIANKNNYGNNFFHFLSSNNRRELKFTRTLKIIASNFSKDWLKESLRIKCKDTGHEWIFLHYLCHKICKPLKPEEWVELIDFLVKTFKKDFVKKLLIATDEKGRTFLHDFCQSPRQQGIVDFFKHLAKIFDQGFLKKLFAVKNSGGWTFLHSFSFYNVDYEDEENTKDFYGLLEFLTKAVDAEYLNRLLLTQNNVGNSFLHILSKYHPDFQMVLNHFQSFDLDFKELILLENKHGNHCFYMKEIIFMDVYHILSNLMSKDDLKDLFLSRKSEGGFLFLHFIKRSERNPSFTNFLKFLEAEFDLNFLKKILSMENDSGYSICSYLQDILIDFHETSFQDFYESLSDNFDKELIRQILTSRDYAYSTVLFEFGKWSINTNYVECFERLIRDFSKQFVEKLLIWRNARNYTIIVEMSRQCESADFLDVFEFLLKEFGVEYLVVCLAIAETDCGNTILHYLLPSIKNIDSLTKIFKFITSNMNKSFLKSLLNFQNLAEFTVIHSISLWNIYIPFEDVLKLLLEEFDKDYLKELLAIRRNDRATFLHVLALANDKVSFPVLLPLLSKEFEVEYFKSLMKVKDADGRTFVQLLSWNENVNFKELFKTASGNF